MLNPFFSMKTKKTTTVLMTTDIAQVIDDKSRVVSNVIEKRFN